jgi:phage tail-like protein
LSVAERKDPTPNYNFHVEFSGSNLIIGSFSEVSGLEANTEFEEYEEGGRNNFSHKLPKRTKYPNLVLKKGVTDSNALYEWHKEVINGKINTREISIILLNHERDEIKRWTFEGAFPVKWSESDLSSTGNSIVMETLEIAHTGLVGVF